ncbi:MAG: hypothetical protein GY858_10125 [Candidatus Omnitrophica bacterium]|nr:hypothetical protein [Candidatus Omnitrophota bacterium]
MEERNNFWTTIAVIGFIGAIVGLMVDIPALFQEDTPRLKQLARELEAEKMRIVELKKEKELIEIKRQREIEEENLRIEKLREAERLAKINKQKRENPVPVQKKPSAPTPIQKPIIPKQAYKKSPDLQPSITKEFKTKPYLNRKELYRINQDYDHSYRISLSYDEGKNAIREGKIIHEQYCEVCHKNYGTQGIKNIPVLAGLNGDTIINFMYSFSNGERKTSQKKENIMKSCCKDDDWGKLAIFYESMDGELYTFNEVKKYKNTSKKGGKLHNRYCEKCHENFGTIDVDGSNRLAGQPLEYLQKAVRDFLTGERRMPKKMAKRLVRLYRDNGEEGIQAIVKFYAHE